MSLLDLLGDDLPDEDEDEDDDPDFDEAAAAAAAASEATAGYGGESYGIPYELGDDDDEEGEEALDAEPGTGEPNDEIIFSHEQFWSPRIRELQYGAMTGGDPASRTGLLTGFGPMLLHQTKDAPHPERPARIVSIYHELIERGYDKRARLVPTRPAFESDLALVHTEEHVRLAIGKYGSDAEAVQALGMDNDTYFAARDSGYAALISSGSVVELSTRVVQGELANALAVVRPPGHHCEARQAMGFCLLNNVCVAVAAVRRRLGVARVLVLDWDVHHGNGVQHIFEEDPTVLYVSLHRYGEGFYPGTGAASEVGIDAGRGTTVNVAWSGVGYGDAEYMAAFDRLIMPIAREYGPDLVMVSAGFDAAAGDPLGGMNLSPTGYAQMTHALASLAGGKLVVALEGGYNLRSISTSSAAVMSTLLGDAPPPLARRAARPEALADIERSVRKLKPFWASLRPPVPRGVGMRVSKRRAAEPATAKRKRTAGAWWWRYRH